MVVKLVKKYGTKQWSEIAAELNTGRLGKQCRERYVIPLSDRLIGEAEPEVISL